MSCVTNPLKDRPSAYAGAVTRLEFVYDYQGRRVSKSVSLSRHRHDQWDTTNWVEQSDTTFLYDSWNLIKEVGRTVPGEPSCETNVNYFVFGLDLSGSLQGAGGVGGLLAEIDDGNVYYPCFDANGNISEYVSTNGTIVAHREYSPYGKTLVSSGTKKADFTHWFSTKPFDQRSGLYSYIFRYYDPDLSAWLSKDPIGERGGLNVYRFVFNSPLSWIDLFGLTCCDDKDKINAVAVEAGAAARKLSDKNWPLEYCGLICCSEKTGNVWFTPPKPGVTKMEEYVVKEAKCSPFQSSCGDDKVVGVYHSHVLVLRDRNRDDPFSGEDKDIGDEHGIPVFVNIPYDGDWRYDPDPGKERKGPVIRVPELPDQTDKDKLSTVVPAA